MQGVSSQGNGRVTPFQRAGLKRASRQEASRAWAWLAGLSLAIVSGCANSDAGSRVAAKATVAAPEQVVQRIEPAPVASVPSAPAAPASAHAPSGAAAPTSEAPQASGEPRANAEPITSKHLEAELNRLEAELR